MWIGSGEVISLSATLAPIPFNTIICVPLSLLQMNPKERKISQVRRSRQLGWHGCCRFPSSHRQISTSSALTTGQYRCWKSDILQSRTTIRWCPESLSTHQEFPVHGEPNVGEFQHSRLPIFLDVANPVLGWWELKGNWEDYIKILHYQTQNVSLYLWSCILILKWPLWNGKIVEVPKGEVFLGYINTCVLKASPTRNEQSDDHRLTSFFCQGYV